ncbi:hypothetical protein PsYK624_012200 [Phanerochaete sordida]|uniref:Uncharacterized protein n=1 Tax=Phanerochaete sordida TaxID=48140 RepID=A0A9P3FZ20_9APHY|nr:hypothetical protein PsYK624_012200 [Phanerochaete sordida]
MSEKFPVTEAQLVALFMEAVTYGIYVVTFTRCAYVLFFDRQGIKQTINWPMVVVMALMAIFTTLDLALGLRHNLDAFVFYHGAGGAAAEFDNISYWVNVMKTVDTQVMSLIGDAMLIYRCFVIFSHSWAIAFVPLLMWLADVACSVMIILITATLHTDTLISQQKLLKPFLYSFFAVTIALNFLTTGLIVWKIRKINRGTTSHVPQKTTGSRRPRTRLEHVIRIIIESGMLYTVFVILTFACELAGSNAIYGVSDMMVVVVGICFNLIIIRVDSTVAGTSSFAVDSAAPPASFPLNLMRSGGVSHTRGVEVVISRDVDRVADPIKHESYKPDEQRSYWDAV